MGGFGVGSTEPAESGGAGFAGAGAGSGVGSTEPAESGGAGFAGAGAGFVVWLTGLSGAGKSTIGSAVANELERRGLLVERLDGDVVRTHLSAGLGFSKGDRDTNIHRIGWVASRLARAGAAVVVSAISPYEDARLGARRLVEEHAPFFLIHVATAVDECARRDTKGLYARAYAGELKDFTGVNDPYEQPLEPELRLDTEGHTPDECVADVLAKLEQLGLVPAQEAVA
jgi:adenylyl-sulfate kinase